MSVIAIDNFSKLDEPRTVPMYTEWLKSRYRLFGQFTANSFARIATVNSRNVLSLDGRSTSTANWHIGYPVPNELDTYVLGFRALNVPATTQGTASFGIVANVDDSSYDTVMAVELISTGMIVHYADADGPKTQTITHTIPADAYIDLVFSKQSTTANEMSRLIVMVNNFPAFTGPLFNNVGTDLSLVIGGIIPTAPGPASAGYLNHVLVTDLVATNLGYSITDMYFSRDGKRFGNPIVSVADIDSLTTDLQSNTDKPEIEVLNQTPAPFEWGQGLGSTVGQFQQPTGLVAQYSALVQSQGPNVQVTVSSGTASTTVDVGPEVRSVSVVADNSAQASLEISE